MKIIFLRIFGTGQVIFRINVLYKYNMNLYFIISSGKKIKKKRDIYKNSYFYHVCYQQKILKDLYILIYCIYCTLYIFIYLQSVLFN